MDDLKSYSDLQNHFNNEDFVLKTQQQIAKDFANYSLFFPDSFQRLPFSKQEIEDQIAIHLSEIMTSPQARRDYGETRLLQLLYTIDISEKQFLHLTTSPDFISELSKKILFREALKVFLRMNFR